MSETEGLSGYSRADLWYVKRRCNGMLSEKVYRKIYDTARMSEGGVFVEVGTAHAAATVCLALGLKDSGHEGVVYTIDKMEGGSRVKYGGRETNIGIARDNLSHFGVDHLVELCVGDVNEEVKRVPPGAELTLLLLDADGQIDRDFDHFYDRLATGSPVIIDDVEDVVRIKKSGRDRRVVDLKMKLSYELVRLYVNHGYLDTGVIVGNTYFGTALNPDRVRGLDSLVGAVYRDIIVSDTRVVNMFSPSQVFRRALLGLLGRSVTLQRTKRWLLSMSARAQSDSRPT